VQRVLALIVVLHAFGTSFALGAIRINEIYYAPEDPADGREFIELRSTTGGVESLDNIWILEIDGDHPNYTLYDDNPGRVLTAINLSGYSTGTNGLFLWRDSNTTLDNSPDSGVQGPGDTTVLSLDVFPGRVDIGYEGDEDGGTKIHEDDVVNFFLVQNFTGSVGDDLDTEATPEKGDGTLNVTPWTAVLDALSVHEVGDHGYQYAESFGGVNFIGTFGADIFSWDPVENMWAFFDSSSGDGDPGYVGPFYGNDGSGFFGSSDAMFQDGREINTAADSEFLYATPGAENVSGVGGLYRGDTDQDGDVDAEDIDLLYDHFGSNESRFDVALNFGLAGQADVDALVQGDNGNHASDLFFTEYGDINLDGDVDALDYLALERGFGADSGWAGGDFNGDHIVDEDDVAIWEDNLGFVAAATSSGTASAVPEPSSFILGCCVLVGLLLTTKCRNI